VRIYVEGGGDTRVTRSQCREGFAAFFRKALPDANQPQVRASGSGREALGDFATALAQAEDSPPLLLVDSEGPVEQFGKPWHHLETKLKWSKPDGATDDHAHLMVQCMESWFLADRGALTSFYGQGFTENSLPRNAKVEEVPKEDVLSGLRQGTRNTKTKGEYHKTRHGFDVLALIAPAKVRGAAPHADRLLKFLSRHAARRQG
jgi:hypothetical protein